MKIVIQCAGSKRPDAGYLKNRLGTRVRFVAHSGNRGSSQVNAYCYRPDELADPALGTWRDVLTRYNADFVRNGSNPEKLSPAGELYEPPVYGALVRRFRPENVFILSAGWGLVRADYLLPDYNITFSNQSNVPKESRRGKRELGWLDFNQLCGAAEENEEVHFFGGQDYLDLFYSMSASETSRAKFVIHYKAAALPQKNGYKYERYMGGAKTNWHYPAAADLVRDLP
jgi:hypothetical protein